MKKIKFLSVLLIIVIAFNNSSFAQHKKPPKGKALAKKNVNMFIKGTNHILHYAVKKYKENEVTTEGKLARALDHQKHAKKMRAQKKPRKAILHSWKARRLAFVSIEANGGVVKPKWRVTPKKVCPPLKREKVKRVIENHKKEDLGELENELDNGVETDNTEEDIEEEELDEE